jgi:hypothetical protein
MANPPITIGELGNVPAPLSPIQSDWAQDVTRRIVQRFASIAERDADWPPATAGRGAVCTVTGNPQRLFITDGATWQPLRDAAAAWGLPAATARKVQAANINAIAVGASLAGLAITWNAPATGRLYLVQLHGHFKLTAGAASQIVTVGIHHFASNALLAKCSFTADPVWPLAQQIMFTMDGPGANTGMGVYTTVVSISGAAGATVDLVADPTNPSTLIAHDIGPMA